MLNGLCLCDGTRRSEGSGRQEHLLTFGLHFQMRRFGWSLRVKSDGTERDMNAGHHQGTRAHCERCVAQDGSSPGLALWAQVRSDEVSECKLTASRGGPDDALGGTALASSTPSPREDRGCGAEPPGAVQEPSRRRALTYYTVLYYTIVYYYMIYYTII